MIMTKKYVLFWLLPIVLLIALYPIVTDNFLVRENIFLMLSYIVFASSMNIIMGYTGYVSFGHIVFYGIGSYVGILLINNLHVHFVIAVLCAALVAGVIALLMGEAVLRLRGAIFAIATIGINEAVKSLVANVDSLGGAVGIFMDFSVYDSYGGPDKALWIAYYAMVILTVLTILVSYFVRNSKLGLGLLAIREDEDTALVVGINTKRFKSIAYFLSAIFPAMAGTIFAFKSGNIVPDDAFHIVKSVEMIFINVFGGLGTVSGPVLGAIIYEKLKDYLLTNPTLKDLHLAVSGVTLLLIVIFAPSGIVGWFRERFKVVRGVLE
jgi:branched-chain amino acid transport system permease protein